MQEIDKPLNLKEFLDMVKFYADECGVTFNDEGNIHSHDIKGSINFYNEEDDQYYEIAGIDVDQLMGCGCWSGLEIYLRKEKEITNEQ